MSYIKEYIVREKMYPTHLFYIKSANVYRFFHVDLSLNTNRYTEMRVDHKGNPRIHDWPNEFHKDANGRIIDIRDSAEDELIHLTKFMTEDQMKSIGELIQEDYELALTMAKELFNKNYLSKDR